MPMAEEAYGVVLFLKQLDDLGLLVRCEFGKDLMGQDSFFLLFVVPLRVMA